MSGSRYVRRLKLSGTMTPRFETSACSVKTRSETSQSPGFAIAFFKKREASSLASANGVCRYVAAGRLEVRLLSEALGLARTCGHSSCENGFGAPSSGVSG